MYRSSREHRKVRAQGAVLLLTACAMLPACAPAARAQSDPAWSLPESATAAQLQDVAGRDGVLLDLWFDADLRYDEGRDGFVGTVTTGYEVWLRDPDDLEEHARIGKREDPFLRVKKIEATVLPTDGRKKQRLAERDLTWSGETESGGGIVTLDAQVYSAVLTGLRPGDRLRVVQTYEWRGHHGMPVLPLRGSDEAWARSRARLRVPLDQEIRYELTGPDSLVAAVGHELRRDGKRQIADWELRDPRDHRWSTVASRPQRLFLVTHLVGDAQPSDGRFAAAASWTETAAGLDARIAPKLEVTPGIAALAASIVAGVDGTPERIAALYDHVQRTTRYLGLFSGDGGIIPAAADDTRRLGYGDCKGLACYLIALCRAVGVEAWPVLVRTNDAGPLAAGVPNLAQFDHMIVRADDGRGGCWLDATADRIPAGVLSLWCAASPVLVCRPDDGDLVEIPREVWAPGPRTYTVAGAIEANQILSAEVTLVAGGPGGRMMEAGLLKMSGSDRESAVREQMLSPALALEEVGPLRLDDRTEPASWRIRVRTRNPLPRGGARVFLPAEIAPLRPLHWNRDARARRFDLRGVPDHGESWTLELPAGWRLARPDSFAIEGCGFRWARNCRQEGNRLELRRDISWTGEILTGDRAGAFLADLEQAIAHERTPIILEKETP